MAKSKLTKRVVDAATAAEPLGAGAKPREKFIWDSELRGFGVQVMPSGLKSFVVHYRAPDGRSRRAVIGRFGLLTVEQARLIAREKLIAASKGIDPMAADDTSGSITVSQICDWYMIEAQAGRLLGRQRRPIKSSTLAMDRSRIESHIKPLLGSRRVKDLKLADVERMQSDIAGGKTSKRRAGSRGGSTTGGDGVAARTVATLHSVFEHALRKGEIENNPARGIRKLASQPKIRRLSRAEIERLGRALEVVKAEGEHPTALAAIHFLLLTGFRRNEVLGLERTWLDDDDDAIRFPDTKSGAQTRAIGRPAVELLLRQPTTSTRFFFPADWGDGHFVGVVRVLDRVCKRAHLSEVTPHTLRHTFASVAADLGFSELTIAALLGHSARGVTQRYVHIDEALRIAADRVADEMANLLKGTTAPRPSRSRRLSNPEESLPAAA